MCEYAKARTDENFMIGNVSWKQMETCEMCGSLIIDPVQWTVIHNFMDHQFQLEDGKLLCG